MLLEAPRRDVIHALRVRASGDVDGRLRLRLTNLLAGAELRPAVLPRAAVLVIRSMSAPMLADAARPEALAARRAWERSLRAHVDACYRTAARPSRGRVPPGAAAVVFEDRAEWLACVLVTWRAPPQWWWPRTLRKAPPSQDPGQALATVLHDEVTYLPAVLDHLVRWNRSEAVGAIPSDVAAALVPVLASRFDLDLGASAEMAHAIGGVAAPTRPFGVPASARSREIALLRSWLPAAAARTLGTPQRALVLVALTLQRRPTWARSGILANLLKEAAAGTMAPAATDGYERTRSGEGRVSFRMPEHPSSGARDGERPVSDHAWGAAGEETLGSPARPAGEPLAKYSAEAGARPEPTLPLRRRNTGTGASSLLDVADAIEPSGHGPEEAEASALEPVSEPQVEREYRLEDDGVSTRLGGVLYLLNLFAALDVPGAFAAWCRSGTLSSWDLLELVARGLLEECDESLVDDPLWSALARLAGRTGGRLPGEGLVGNSAVMMPRTWVQDQSKVPTHWFWASRRGRLCIWGETEMAVALVPCETAPSVQGREALGRLGIKPSSLSRRPFASAPLATFGGPLAHRVPEGVRPWLAVAVPLLRHRLVRALGSGCSVEEMLLLPGRLFLTSSHVDLVQSLEGLPFAVRRAGLDRDPGWMPTFGRVVYFHFEGRETLLA